MKLATLGLLVATQLFGQSEFEVATVRLSNSGARESYLPTLDVAPGSTLRITNRRLDEIIMLAYNVGGRQLSGPAWLTELTSDPDAVTRFDIQAKVPDDAKKADIPVMLQRLLEERFKLKTHRESRATQVYALEVAKGGHKLQPAGASLEPGCKRVVGTEPDRDYSAFATCANMTMVQLAAQLQSLAPAYFRDGPIVDQTGLSGAFDLRLEWRTVAEIEAGITGPTMFDAVKKLGLTLDRKRDTAEMLIVDQCEKLPTEN